ncbi:MAG: hypothetical protein HXY40_04850 [Chloroflexi bacterium]|nr:hypothetical protein [Chloroflexota bacterium]
MTKANGVKTLKIEANQEIAEKQQRGVVKIRKVLLADESVLYTRLRNYHWNVTGMNFMPPMRHLRGSSTKLPVWPMKLPNIRQYGANAPGTINEFSRKARLGALLQW